MSRLTLIYCRSNTLQHCFYASVCVSTTLVHISQEDRCLIIFFRNQQKVFEVISVNVVNGCIHHCIHSWMT